MNLLPVEPAWRLADRAEDQRWLVSGLWSEQAVGIIGGEPKCCKSFLALDLAVAVAAGVPCLRRFAVPRAGRVLLYAAEDALHIVRRRLDGICAAAGLGLADLDVQVITAPTVRLDLHFELFGDVHTGAWRLLAVAQGRVEDPHSVRIRRGRPGGRVVRGGRFVGLGRAHG